MYISIFQILESDVPKSSVESPPLAAPIRYEGLNDDLNFAIPKHVQHNHKNSRIIFKRSIFNNLLNKNNKNKSF